MRIANTIQTALLCELFFVIPVACNVATNEKASVNTDGENDTSDTRDKETQGYRVKGIQGKGIQGTDTGDTV